MAIALNNISYFVYLIQKCQSGLYKEECRRVWHKLKEFLYWVMFRAVLYIKLIIDMIGI